MTLLKKRNLCAKCNIAKAIATCNGCQLMFCINHFTEHREELSNLMNNVSTEHDHLRGDLCQEVLEHPFLSRIDTWEQESIKQIQAAAQTARVKLQQIFTRKKEEIKSSVEKLHNELQHSRDSADYTENDLNRWAEKLKNLQNTLKDWSAITIEGDDHSESVIRLIKIADEQSAPTIQSSCPDEKFDKTDSEVILSEDDLVATYRSKRSLFSSRYIYGVNRYSSGKHSIHFSIEKKEDASLFFGIISGSKKYDQSFLNPNNSSVYGWHNTQSFVMSGKSQEYNEKPILAASDEIILFLNCDEQQILLQHQSTKRLFQISVCLEKCPFPWKLMLSLSNSNDSIRIIN